MKNLNVTNAESRWRINLISQLIHWFKYTISLNSRRVVEVKIEMVQDAGYNKLMSNKMINPEALFDSRQFGFSQIVTTEGKKTVYMSGQVGWDENQQIVGPGDLGVQMAQAIRNIETGLKAAGATLADVVLLRLYIVASEIENSGVIKDVLKEFFPGDNPPASTWLYIHSLANEDFLIEVEPVAVLS